MQAHPPRSNPRTKLAAGACAALLLGFYLIGWQAVLTKSATIDEPLHAAGAYFHVFENDFRVNPEDPPLWNYLAMLPHRRGELGPDPDEELWANQLKDVMYQFSLTTRLLFYIPENDGAAFINASRGMMLIVGVALGAAIACWSWQIAGAAAGVIACALFALDPNFLAHSPLVKNDVAITLVLFCMSWAAWSCGRRGRWWNILLVGVLCGAAPAVKFSGVIAAPILVLILLTRAMLSSPWIVLGRELTTRLARLGAAAGIGALAAGMTILIIWGSYGFRFDPTPIPGSRLSMDNEIRRLKETRFSVNHDLRWPTPEELEATSPGAVGHAVLWAERHKLLPQAWLYGFVYTYRSTLIRGSFLLGQRSVTGWWYYFPLAMLFKTPLASLAAIGVAVVTAFRLRRRISSEMFWTLACLGLPLLVYAASSMSSNLNLGLRHVLPLYPFIFVLVAMALFGLPHRALKPMLPILALGLLVESVAAFPHYISFFNAFSRPYRMHLLSDSNFDWGQDLTYVAEWQQRHPATRLYLGYWASVDPEFYGIRYTNIPGGFVLNPNYEWPPQQSGVIAIAATLLQGVNCPPSCIEFYAPLRARKPREILGDTIYLYDWPLR